MVSRLGAGYDTEDRCYYICCAIKMAAGGGLANILTVLYTRDPVTAQ